MSLAGGTDAPPPEYLRTVFCERMGWTFAEYGDTDMADIYDTLAVWDAINKHKAGA